LAVIRVIVVWLFPRIQACRLGVWFFFLASRGHQSAITCAKLCAVSVRTLQGLLWNHVVLSAKNEELIMFIAGVFQSKKIWGKHKDQQLVTKTIERV
jgi:hypothetical protein